MLKIDGIDGLTPSYEIIDAAEDYLQENEWCRSTTGQRYAEKTLRRIENKLVSEILDAIGDRSAEVEEILAADNGVVLITAIDDFVSVKYTLSTLYKKYDLENESYIGHISYAMARVIEMLADVTIGNGCRAATKHMTLIMIRAALGSIEAYAGLLFQADITKFSIQDKVLYNNAASALAGGLRNILGFTYVMGGRQQWMQN